MTYDSMPMNDNVRREMPDRTNMNMNAQNNDMMQTGIMQGGTMRMGRRRSTEETDRVAEQVYSTLNEQMCKGISFHEQLADYFCFLGLQGFKRMLEYQYMKECADKRKLHRRYIDHHHRLIPVKQVQYPVLIPSDWMRYKTTDIDDSVISKFVKSAIEQYKQWEEKTKELYEEQCDILRDAGMVSDMEYVKELVLGVEKELKKIHRMMEGLNGTGYDVTTIHGMQDKYHEKYKKKYNDRFTTKNNYRPMPPYGEYNDEDYPTRRKRIGFI